MAKKPETKEPAAAEPKTDKPAETEAAEAEPSPSATLTVRPVGDRKVRNPATGKFLDAKGEAVRRSRYWERQLGRGVVEEVTE